MSPTNFNKAMEEMEQAQTESVSDFFKFPTGSVRIRVLTDAVPSFALYKGDYPNSKYQKLLPHYVKPEQGYNVKSSAWSWAIIRAKTDKTTNQNTEDELKIVQFPYSMITMLNSMFSDSDWSFDSFPMPYDITVNNTGEGGSRYSIIGSPKRTDVPQEMIGALDKKKSCADIIKTILEKQGGKQVQGSSVPYPSNENDPNEEGVQM